MLLFVSLTLLALQLQAEMYLWGKGCCRFDGWQATEIDKTHSTSKTKCIAKCNANPKCVALDIEDLVWENGLSCFEFFGDPSKNFRAVCDKDTHDCYRKKGKKNPPLVKPTTPEGRSCKTKYTTKWPHCNNIKCFPANSKREDAEKACLADKKCNGYSWTLGMPDLGSGCLKKDCAATKAKGFGTLSHGFRECVTEKNHSKVKPGTIVNPGPTPPKKKPQDCQMSAWKQTSACSKKCGGGTFEVTAKIIKQATGNGKKCGQTIRHMPCNVLPCPIDGKYGSFGPWSKCSRSCGGGIKRRARECNKPKPRNGGAFCKGAISQFSDCNKSKCTGAKSCADLRMLYAKAMAKIKGERVAAVKAVAGFTLDLTLLRDEVRDGEQLTIGINKLPAGELKSKATPLVKRMLADARKALQDALDKLRDAKAGIAGYDKKLKTLKTEFTTKIAKCTCDGKKRELMPLIMRAEAKIEDYDKEIKFYKATAAQQNNAISKMRNLSSQYGKLPKPLGPLMTKMFHKLITIEEAKIDGEKAEAKKRTVANKYWLGKVLKWKKELATCSAKVKVWSSDMKATLEQIDMSYVWDETEFGLAYEEDVSFESEKMQQISSRVLSDETFVTPENVEQFPVESGFTLLMVAGGLGAFYFGRRNSQSDNYQSLE